MKFGNLYWQNTVIADSRTLAVNIGDNLQFMAIDYLYSRFITDTAKIVKLQIGELKHYQGESVILPLNWSLFDPAFMEKDRICISENIIPVFLGMTIESHAYKEVYFNSYNLAYLRKHEPIGCRDQYTADMLRKYHVQAYLNGCMTCVFPKRKNRNQNKIFFIDVPIELEKYIPYEILGKYEVMTQQYYFDRTVEKESVLDFVKAQYHKYADEAKLVVTSRLHVASPCMAMGIPVIFTKNQIDARFGWLDRFISLYDKEHYGQINWIPRSIEYEETKELIVQNAIKRIIGTYEQRVLNSSVEAIYVNREKRDYINFQETIFNNFEKAIIFLKDNYSQNDEFIYSIWGINSAAENFYEYINRKYPNAKLKNVIDAYKETEFHGIPTIKPESFKWEDKEVIFVLPVKASNEAPQVFAQKGIDSRYYVCCGDQFVKGTDINGKV